MTIITGPVIPERTSAAKVVLPAEPPAPPQEIAEPTPQTEPEETAREVPCFTAPAPVRRKKLSFFGTAAAQLLLAFAAGGILWLGANFGGDTFGRIPRGIVDFLVNG